MATLLPILNACDDGVGPILELTEFELCSKPDWIAVRNGSNWDGIDVPEPQYPFGPVRVSVRVAERTSVAIGYSGSIQIYQLLQEELDQLRCQSTFPPFRTMTGSVAGIADGAPFQLAFGGSAGFRIGPGTFTVGVRDTIATIIAMHRQPGSQRPAGFLLVRGFSSSGQNTFPALDFSSPGVRVLDSARLSVSGAAGSVFRSTALITGSTTMSFEASQLSGAPYHYALSGTADPADLYSVSLSATSKTLTWFYAGLSGDASAAFGPDLPAIAAENVPDPRCRRMAVAFPVQTELASGASVTFSFPTHPRFGTSVSVTVSQGFRGTSDRWEVEIPDFGPTRSCAVLNSVTPGIVVTAFGGDFRLKLGALPVAGNMIRSASASRPGP